MKKSLNTSDARKAVTTLISNPTPDEAGKAVKTLNKYFDEVNALIDSVNNLMKTLKEVI